MRRHFLTLIFFFALLLTACGGDNQAAGGQETPTPTATVDPSGYQMIAAQSCLVNQWNTLQSEQRRGETVNWMQGDLVAWRPGSQAGLEIAYIVPGDRSSWFTGVLTLARGKNFNEHISLAPGVLANGDLTWSPGGDWLAFLAYRPNESLYTVMAVRHDGSGLVDLFPTDLARSDARSSQKAILGWRDATTLQVITSCGDECRQSYAIDVTAPPAEALMPTPVDDYTRLRENLQLSRSLQTITPAAFPKNIRLTPPAPTLTTLKWAPDGKQMVYLDRRGILWYLSVPDKTNYILDIGLRDVHEVQWSGASDTLAIRAEDRIFVFEIPCRTITK